MFFVVIPQTVACQLGVLAVNLSIRLWPVSFSPCCPPHFVHTSLLIFTFSKYRFQNVAVAPAKVPNAKCVIVFLQCLISKCCCGPRQNQNFALHHHVPVIVTSRILQKHQGFPSKLECLFLVAGCPSSVFVKFLSNHKHFWSA